MDGIADCRKIRLADMLGHRLTGLGSTIADRLWPDLGAITVIVRCHCSSVVIEPGCCVASLLAPEMSSYDVIHPGRSVGPFAQGSKPERRNVYGPTLPANQAFLGIERLLMVVSTEPTGWKWNDSFIFASINAVYWFVLLSVKGFHAYGANKKH